MKITLQGKTYYILKYTPSMVMDADRLLEKGTAVSLGDEPAFLDEVIPFIANSVFAGQFTADDFLNHYTSATVTIDILGMLGAVRGTVSSELAQFPPSDDEKENSPKNAKRGRKRA